MIKVELTIKEIEIIFQSLAGRPWHEVENLMHKLDNLANEYNLAQTKEMQKTIEPKKEKK